MQQLTGLATLCCWLFVTGAAADVGKEGIQKSTLSGDKKVGDPTNHFDITPEVVKVLINLIRLDRTTLKTITENQNTVWSMGFTGIVTGSYQYGSEVGDCYHTHARPLYGNLPKRTNVVNDKIDRILDEMIENWVTKRTPDELEAYWKQFWEARNKLYRYATRQIKTEGCGNIHFESCQGFSAQHQALIDTYDTVVLYCGDHPKFPERLCPHCKFI